MPSILIITLSLLFSPNMSFSHGVNKLIDQDSRIIFFADTNHDNLNLKATYVELVDAITQNNSSFNCIFLESDHKIFQPAIDEYLSGKENYSRIEKAQRKWEQLTGRNYLQVYEPLIRLVKDQQLNLIAVDWSDASEESKLMKSLFDKGFKNQDLESLDQAFHLGVEVRNEAMAKNIAKKMKTETNPSGICNNALFFVGALHLTTNIDMPMGNRTYKAIGQFSDISGLKQQAHEIFDCSKAGGPSAIPAELSARCSKTPAGSLIITEYQKGFNSFANSSYHIIDKLILTSR